MDTEAYKAVLEQAEKLPRAQRLMLIERLIQHMRSAETTANPVIEWEAYAGSAPYPLCGEDAQEWVSRSRSESDEVRQAR